MRIAVGSDHAGFAMKEIIREYVVSLGHEVLHLGPETAERTDYPLWGAAVGRSVVNGEADLGIAICGSGVGISIAANKVPGVRAACVSEPYSARYCRLHNNANVLCFGGRVVGEDVARLLVDEFLGASFEGGRHAERVALIGQLDKEHTAAAS
ncbi:MAG: ribose 5-phosphate isomerase B [Propionibacteriaceae bacterium]